MRAVVLGGAACVWDDLDAANELCDFDMVVATNDAATVFERVDVWATLHPEKVADWKKRRRKWRLPAIPVIVTHDGTAATHALDYRWPGMTGSGSSGLYAAKVALWRGAAKVVLCGVPMDSDGHFYEAHRRGAKWAHTNNFTAGWNKALPHIRDSVRSMSGWTRDLLGAPSPDWLA